MGPRLTPERARRLAHTLTGLWARELDPQSMRAPAIVFSPHQDDEILGCGGTIMKKRGLGASVEVVYMTDGTTSPPNVPVKERGPLREREACAACQALGVDQGQVTFLRFVDGQLSEHVEPATERVIQFLSDHPAEQIFVPYRQDRDPGLDHTATHRIVSAALRHLGSRAAVYEYPVWYWRWWPRTRLPVRGQPGVWNTQPRSTLPNLRSLAEFGACVDIGDVLDRKQRALNQHQSQLEILYSIQSGAFVKWFFGKRELFRHRPV